MSESPQALTQALGDGVIAIDTEYWRPNLAASHLVIENRRAAFIDTGVNASVPLLLATLEQADLDVADVDYVFLTHVHLDHAGGAGLLLEHLPNARCVVHPRGAPHLIDPLRLVAGTEAVYGKRTAREIYGRIRPIDVRRIIEPTDGERYCLAGREFEILFTEGHARHHYCLSDPCSRGVFTGDNFGVSYREFDTRNGAFIFPTSTPIDFDPVEAHKAVDRILGYAPEQVYLTHFSRVREVDKLAAEMHAGIDAYVAMAYAHAAEKRPSKKLRSAMLEYFLGGLERHGFQGERDAIESALALDVELNAQGLEVWLDRQ